MLDISTVLFFLLCVSVLFIYRITRAGYKSVLFFNKNLDVDNKYSVAENIRVIQVGLGFTFFIYHSVTFFGIYNSILFFFSSFVISLFLEIIGTNKGFVFDKFSYDSNLCPGPMIGNVPLLIAVSWTGLIYMGLVCTMMSFNGEIVTSISLTHIIIASIFVTILDLVLDPIAVDEGRWKWDEPGRYYGIPLKNFIGWFFNSFVILTVYSFFINSHTTIESYSRYIEFSPGILFLILPAIAARPCFERKLNIAGILGLLFTIILSTINIKKFI